MKAIDKLKNKLQLFNWEQENKNESIFGSITVPQIEKRINKDFYRLNNINIFISGKMGGTKNNPPFRYALIYQKGNIRPYKHKNFSELEYKKIFLTDKGLDGIVTKIIDNFDINLYEK